MYSIFRCSIPPGSNVYFVNTDPAVIIDTGSPDSAKQMLDILNCHVPLDNVGYILCTHTHGDHIGGVSSFQRAFHAKTMMFMPEVNSKLTDKHRREIRLIHEMPEIDSYLEADMQITLGDDTVRIIHTPGHTDDHCCFYFTKRKYLFTGDLLANEDIGFLNLNKHYTTALDETKHSIEQCATLETTRVFTGHGDIYRIAPWQKMKRKLSLFERNPILLVSHTLISPFLFHLWAAGRPVPVEESENYIVDHADLFDGFLENCTPDLILQEFRKLATLLLFRGIVNVADNCYSYALTSKPSWQWYKRRMKE